MLKIVVLSFFLPQEDAHILSLSQPRAGDIYYRLTIDGTGSRMRAFIETSDDEGRGVVLHTDDVTFNFEQWYLMTLAWDNVIGRLELRLLDVSTQQMVASAEADQEVYVA